MLLFILAYLLGSISSAVIICRLFNLPDPRIGGSNNPGATNVLRLAGKKAALATLLLDGLKGALAALAVKYLLSDDLLLISLAGFAAFLGHIYPLWFGFKGGKGVATFIGVLCILNIWAALCSVFIWLLSAKILKISSLAALIMAALSPFYFYYFSTDLSTTLVVFIIVLWIFWTHRNNIKRLLKHSEAKINTQNDNKPSH